jgi:hypothetical protein
MRKFLLVLGIMALVCSPAMAGKNAGGALVVHTDDAVNWTGTICQMFDSVVPQDCEALGTRTDKDEYTSALIWFIAAFPEGSSPGVAVAYFGNDHNLPEYYHNRWGFCDNGMAGSLEVPDTGWPDLPATAGNSVAWGSPILGDLFFPVYYFDVWGYADVYYCSAKNPNGVIDGVPTPWAGYVDDSNPPVTDYIADDNFGCVRWYAEGYNGCPTAGPPTGACCLVTGQCVITAGVDSCLALADAFEYKGDGTQCEPNPCDQPGGCCFDDGHCEVLLEVLCYDAGGTLWLEGDDCVPNNCPPPPQACCDLATGDCYVLPPDECIAMGYEVYPEPDCDPNPCPPPPTEACCFEDGSCQDLLPDECTAIDGIPWGPGTACEPENPCPPPPTGACCYGCEECLADQTEAECMAIEDWYLWLEGEDCDPNPCPPVATETTTWGSIKSNYR